MIFETKMSLGRICYIYLRTINYIYGNVDNTELL